ncbi:MAG: haloacid dehalogenase, partial [Bdellovibrionaceae bacterium]|nr:haloacid dehalogenase [Pseudobdellovibrionaceae bacterium]MDW8190755.1 haloacid dehalogenase [Pseudobdellovibrionaceae bacterium]
EWSKQHLEKNPPPVFPAQKELIDFFKKKGVKIYVVTASISWAVQPAVFQYFGLPYESVLGLELVVKNNRISPERRLPGTYREGKRDMLLKVTGHIRPFFACGNSTGDQHLLECADLALAVRSSARQHGLKEAEDRLFLTATQKGWLTHDFVPRS